MVARHPLRVVIVNYDSCRYIEKQLESGVFDRRDEIVLVDNASEPARLSAMAAMHGATSILVESNLGFAKAVNIAVRASTTHWPILLLNPDVTLTANDLREMLSQLEAKERGPSPTAVAPLLVDSHDKVQVGAAGGPLTLGSVLRYFWFASHIWPNALGVFLTRRQLTRCSDVDWLCMACLLLRPDAFDDYGPIPEDELVYAEDLAWGTAATQAGARFKLLPQCRVVHERGGSGGSSRWIGALERLIRRRMSMPKAQAAIIVLRSGLAARRAIGRKVT
jgi:GT2 family glycosyltransferase